MIDYTKENLITLAAAGKLPTICRPDGKPASYCSVSRYARAGARCNSGKTVKLEVLRTPSGLRTTVEAVARFVAALNDAPEEGAAVTSSRVEADAEAYLAAAGVIDRPTAA